MVQSWAKQFERQNQEVIATVPSNGVTLDTYGLRS